MKERFSSLAEEAREKAAEAREKLGEGVAKLSETQAVKDAREKISESTAKIAETQAVKDAREKISESAAKIAETQAVKDARSAGEQAISRAASSSTVNKIADNETISKIVDNETVKKISKNKNKRILVIGAALAVLVLIITIGSLSGGSTKIDSYSEAEKYALKHLSATLTVAAEINKTPGYSLFAIGSIDEQQAVLTVSSITGERIEGYYIFYTEAYSYMVNIIVTYDGDIYMSPLYLQSSSTTAKTALYEKVFDAKKGWLMAD